jgi:predicted RNase H-like nuclease (RuvC/YqgF family)
MKLDEEPAELRNSVPALQVTNTQLEAENATLRARVTELEAQLKNATGVDIEAIKAEVRQQCEEEKKKALEELDAKASQEIETRDKTIEKLEKKIKKLGGESDGE